MRAMQKNQESHLKESSNLNLALPDTSICRGSLSPATTTAEFSELKMTQRLLIQTSLLEFPSSHISTNHYPV